MDVHIMANTGRLILPLRPSAPDGPRRPDLLFFEIRSKNTSFYKIFLFIILKSNKNYNS